LREQIILARLMISCALSCFVDASEVEAYFKAHQDEFNQPAQARVRHIFFRIDPGAPPPQLDAVRERASRVLRKPEMGAISSI